MGVREGRQKQAFTGGERRLSTVREPGSRGRFRATTLVSGGSGGRSVAVINQPLSGSVRGGLVTGNVA